MASSIDRYRVLFWAAHEAIARLLELEERDTTIASYSSFFLSPLDLVDRQNNNDGKEETIYFPGPRFYIYIFGINSTAIKTENKLGHASKMKKRNKFFGETTKCQVIPV